MLHLVDVAPGKALRPGAVDWLDQTLIPAGAEDDRLSLQLANLHDPRVTHDLDACVVTITAGANA